MEQNSIVCVYCKSGGGVAYRTPNPFARLVTHIELPSTEQIKCEPTEVGRLMRILGVDSLKIIEGESDNVFAERCLRLTPRKIYKNGKVDGEMVNGKFCPYMEAIPDGEWFLVQRDLLPTQFPTESWLLLDGKIIVDETKAKAVLTAQANMFDSADKMAQMEARIVELEAKIKRNP